MGHAQLRDHAIAEHQAGRHDAAFVAYRACLRAAPGDAGLWTNLGVLLRLRGEHRLAVTCHRRALALTPDDMVVLNNLGNALHDADLLDEALSVRETLTARRPDDLQAHAMHVATLRALGRMEAAVAVADAALTQAPGDAELQVQKAMALLALGDYAAGFAAFRARWHTGEITRPPAREPEWDGGDPAGRHILVLPEQGLGDTLLMSRFLPPLRARGAEVSFAPPPALARLLAGMDGVDHLLGVGDRRPQVDAVVHMMDLPGLLGARPEALPPAPRLIPPAEARGRGRRIVAPHAGRLKVGVVWSGSVTYKANFKRSIGPRAFAPLADIPGVTLFSLYKGPLLDSFRRSAESAVIIDAAGDDRDFADAAGLIAELDLVIGVDTGVVHLAATLGRPVWNLLAHAPYWLYGQSGDVTPWHPTMRLFRQDAPGDWDGVLSRVEAALRALAAGRGGAG